MSARVHGRRRRRVRAWVAAGAAVLALASGADRAAGHGGAPGKGPGVTPPGPTADGHETVTLAVAEGVVLTGTYAANGARKGSPVLLLVHGEDEHRASFTPLHASLDEHRVPWLAIDLRGFGDSRTQGGVDLGPLAAGDDADLHRAQADDVYGAIRWLVDVKGHDPLRVGVMASKLGAAAALHATRLHKGDVATLVTMTPAAVYAGLDTVEDVRDQHGPMAFWVLSSVEDMNRFENEKKKGPRHLLYVAEHARNAPSGTPFDERDKKRRGIPPHLRAFAEDRIPGTKMIEGVAHFDAWLAAFWARTLSTYPHPVLYDGSVDPKGDYADPEWAAGVELEDAGGAKARVLRWGRRLMIGGSMPKDVTAVHLRIQGTRGERQRAGQYARIDFPSGAVTTAALVRGFGRAPPTETSALVLQSEEIPQRDGSTVYGDPSFEAEVRLPEIVGGGAYEIRVAFALSRGGREPTFRAGVDPENPATWTVIPDQLDGTGLPYLPAGGPAPAEHADDDGAETPDGPLDPNRPPKPKGR